MSNLSENPHIEYNFPLENIWKTRSRICWIKASPGKHATMDRTGHTSAKNRKKTFYGKPKYRFFADFRALNAEMKFNTLFTEFPRPRTGISHHCFQG